MYMKALSRVSSFTIIMSVRRSSRLSSSSAASEQNVKGDALLEAAAMLPPATPSPRKRRKVNDTAQLPTTPTPSAIGLMAAPAFRRPDADGVAINSPSQNSTETSPTRKPRARKARPAQPHMTNAPLQTPRGSKVLADLSAAPGTEEVGDEDDEPMTTENLLEKANAHLIKQDPRMKDLIGVRRCHLFSPEGLAEEIEPFQSLTSGIIGQQVSGAAAKSIRNKFISLFHVNEDGTAGKYPTPEEVIKTDLATLRTAGLSARKAEYIQGLAEKFVSGELTAKMLVEASDEEVLQKLVAVRGLGRWSVEMFACFSLKRTDIFSTGDLGVQYGASSHLLTG